jgi:hypothetical protein
MKTLDLDHLTMVENDTFNQVSLKNRQPFNKIVETISRKHEKNIDWVVSSLPSRNKYQSMLYHRVCQIALIQELDFGSEGYEFVKTSDSTLAKVLRQYFCRNEISIRVVSTETLPARIWRIIRPIRQFTILMIYLILRMLSRNRDAAYSIPEGTKITLLDTFVLNGEPGDGGTIHLGRYKDRYYPGLANYLTREEKRNFFYYPTIVGYHNPIRAFKMIRQAEDQFIIPDDYLTLRDYLFMLCHPFRLLALDIPQIVFKGVNITPLMRQERLRNCYDHIGIYGILNHQFALRLAKSGVKVRLLVDWYENQVLDRGMILGFHKYHPETPVIGYQGYVISPALHLYIFPNQTEFNGGVVPDTVAVLGRGLIPQIHEFCSDIVVKTAPAFRNNKVWNERINYPDENMLTVMLGLPISLSDSRSIIKKVLDAHELIGDSAIISRYMIKPHPTHKISTITELFEFELPEYCKFVTGDFHQVIETSNILVTNASTVALEALAKAVPVIIVGDSNGITQNPIPETVDRVMWEICFTANDIASSIMGFVESLEKNKQLFQSLAQNIRDEIFTPVNRETVRAFLHLE